MVRAGIPQRRLSSSAARAADASPCRNRTRPRSSNCAAEVGEARTEDVAEVSAVPAAGAVTLFAASRCCSARVSANDSSSPATNP
jgi:hypothetical protein